MIMTRKIATALSGALLVAAAVPGVVADEGCKTINEIICETDDLQNFCGLIGGTATESLFEDKDLTVFVPTNAAVTSMDFVSALDDEKLREVVLFHVYGKELHTKDMECEAGWNVYTMESGKDSRTLCVGFEPTFQKGGGNPEERKPSFVSKDTKACNGVIHTVDRVMLPAGFEVYEAESAIESKETSGTSSQRSSWYAFAAIFLFVYL
jgi:uncharacterized surface protein with fasciclin (FAS1) repeats